MSVLDWRQFLDDHEIEYVTRGSNTKKGEISVRCPWCGEDDPSQHLGISLTSDKWGCYRNVAHRGRSAARLVAGLTGCSSKHALGIVAAYSAVNPDTLGQALAALTATSEPPKAPDPEVFRYPPEFRRIQRDGLSRRFWFYLQGRGFDNIGDLTDRYGLLCASTGRYHDRVIVPVYQRGQLVGWTGRAIQKTTTAPRYLTSSDSLKKTVFNEDDLREGGKVLFITEGPFDALKLDYYGEPLRARATCGFGVALSLDQICILREVRRIFSRVVILFDKDAIEPAFAFQEWLQYPNVMVGSLPEGLKDPGELKRDQAESLIKSYLK